jgi:hypothetical protein
MNHKYLYIAFVAILFLGTSPLFGQENSDEFEPNKWSMQLNFQHQDLLFDLGFGQLSIAHNVKIRPFYTLELYRYKQTKNPNRRLFALAELGYYNNLYHNRWLSLKLGVGSEYQIGNFFISSRIQGGLANVKSADIQYIYKEGKWIVSEETRLITKDLLISPRIDIGYRIRNNNHPIDIVINYQMTFYFSPVLEINIPYHGYGVGVRYGF